MALEDYLESLSAGGGKREPLSFTLNQARALEKLSSSQLPDRALWIVKMVQAAVRGKATGIDIKLGRNRIEVQFDSAQVPRADELFELVRSGQLSQDPFLLHLLTGIRACFAGEGLSYLLQTVGEEGRNVIALSEGDTLHFQDDKHVSSERVFTLVVRRPYRMAKFRRALDSHVSQLLKGTAEEHMELMTRCWASPVPIRIDGRLLDCRYDSPLMFRGTISSLGARQQKRHALLPPVNIYLRHYPPEQDRPTLPVIPYDQGQTHQATLENGEEVTYKKPVYLHGRFLEWCYDQETASRILLSPIGQGREPAIYFVQDGALLQRVGMNLVPPVKVLGINIPLGKGGGDCMIVPVDFADLDLSQFSLSRVEQRRTEMIDWLQVEALRSSRAALELIKHFFPIASTERVAKGALALAGTAAIPVTLSFGAPGLAAYSLYQGFFAGGSLMFGSGVKRVIVAAAKKMEEVWVKTKLSELEQPPIE